MLSLKNPLHFPKLVYVGKVSRSKPKEVWGNLYRLDWVHQEGIIRDKYDQWVKDYQPNRGLEFIPAIPIEYSDWMEGLTFALQGVYLREIKRNARQAVTEWNIPRDFDTSIREMCLAPASEHIKVAFKLLGDCIYDEETHYYSREGKRRLFSYAALSRFWYRQTGSYYAKCNAELPKLEALVKESTLELQAPAQGKFLTEARAFLLAMAILTEDREVEQQKIKDDNPVKESQEE